MAELADALDLGSSVNDVGVQVPLAAPKNTAEKISFLQYFFYPNRRFGISSLVYHHALACISSVIFEVYHTL